jgi:hypothetical protein
MRPPGSKGRHAPYSSVDGSSWRGHDAASAAWRHLFLAPEHKRDMPIDAERALSRPGGFVRKTPAYNVPCSSLLMFARYLCSILVPAARLLAPGRSRPLP